MMPRKTLRTLTPNELEKYNGKEGKPSYVAVNGEVYDVSTSPTWKKGRHLELHRAGCDLTEALSLAPHGKGVFERFKKVGVLVSTPSSAEAIRQRIPPPTWASKLISIHCHPIAAHFPQAFFIFAPLFLVLFYATGARSFERTAYHLLCVGTLMALPATGTGFLHWWYKYGGRQRPVFRLKIILSLLLLPVAGLVFAFHTACGVLTPNSINWAILFLYFVMVPLVVLLGRAGGLIVFGGKGQ
jgi:predicted heme/steroid binding protein/uncharacterized membrane protein